LVSSLAENAGLRKASIVLRRLGTCGGQALLDPEQPHAPASMIKVPIAAVLVADWAEGRSAPADLVTVEAQNLTPNDLPSPLVAGYRSSLEEVAGLMLTRSDNVATNVLIDVLGRERVGERCRSWGLQATAVRRKLSGALPLIEDPAATGRNSHPAGDSARLFGLIAQGSHFPNRWLLAALAAQEWNEKLPVGLSAGDRFAHKTGDTDEVSHDGGILDLAAGPRWIVVVYSALPSSPANDERFGRFMRDLRPHLA